MRLLLSVDRFDFVYDQHGSRYIVQAVFSHVDYSPRMTDMKEGLYSVGEQIALMVNRSDGDVDFWFFDRDTGKYLDGLIWITEKEGYVNVSTVKDLETAFGIRLGEYVGDPWETEELWNKYCTEI
jgi:hypothetical protein